MDENVLVLTLDERAPVPPVTETLTRLDSAGELELRAAATVHRSSDGEILVEERMPDDEAGRSVAERHPRLAVLLGVLAGPLDTLLLGNSLVAIAGAVAEPDPDDLALEYLARSIPPGRTAVVAQVGEPDPDVVDGGWPTSGYAWPAGRSPRSRRRWPAPRRPSGPPRWRRGACCATRAGTDRIRTAAIRCAHAWASREAALGGPISAGTPGARPAARPAA